jgi:hypothetical protein
MNNRAVESASFVGDDWLHMGEWKYSLFFDPLSDVAEHPVVREIEQYIEHRQLDEHQFFRLANHSKSALVLWATQELVMTNAFSQLVLRAASCIPNVHARAVLVEIASGEHGLSRRGIAKHAHPWLLSQLGSSIDLDLVQVSPAEPTRMFIRRLASHIDTLLNMLAYIGVGNERLIIPEYTAVKKCFAAQWPESRYKLFLDANLNEDISHSQLCYLLASMVIKSERDAESFRSAAIASIDSRFEYFDGLQALVESEIGD